MPGAATAPSNTDPYRRLPAPVTLVPESRTPPAQWRWAAAHTLGSVVSAGTAAALLVAVSTSSAVYASLPAGHRTTVPLTVPAAPPRPTRTVGPHDGHPVMFCDDLPTRITRVVAEAGERGHHRCGWPARRCYSATDTEAPMWVMARHAHAGSKTLWTGDDADRPLSPLGWDQARHLVLALDDVELHTPVSSPTARCRQTLEPLAAVGGLAVDEHRLLGPDAPIERLFEWVSSRDLDGVMFCTHGEVLTGLATLARSRGAAPLPPAGGTEKGAAWLIDHRAPAPDRCGTCRRCRSPTVTAATSDP